MQDQPPPIVYKNVGRSLFVTRSLSVTRAHCSRLRLNPLGLRKRYKERYSFLCSCCGDSRLVQFKDLNRGSELLSWLSPLGLVQFKVLNHGSEPLPKSLRSPSVGWFSGSKGRFNGSSRDGAAAPLGASPAQEINQNHSLSCRTTQLNAQINPLTHITRFRATKT
jgi:hypothetical protein